MTRFLRPAVTRPAADALAVVLVLAAVWVWAGAPAYAQTQLQLVSSEPADGVILLEPPREMTLTFSELHGTVSIITVYDPDRVVVSPDTGGLVGPTRPTTLRVPLVPLTKPGRYTTHYIVTASDGRPIFGILSFTIGHAPNPARHDVAGPDQVGAARPPEAAPAASEGSEGDSGPSWPWIVVGVVAVAASVAGLVRLRLVDLRR